MIPPTQIVLQLNTQGQLIIPMDLRVILNLKEEDVVCAYLENNRLIFEKQANIKQKLKNRFAAVTESLADELIEERRQAATLES
jgi:bifunctional DNA-binding transcriptional regulator/antitoxin component of YhaV-PrlF toxin-antitoxin module